MIAAPNPPNAEFAGGARVSDGTLPPDRRTALASSLQLFGSMTHRTCIGAAGAVLLLAGLSGRQATVLATAGVPNGNTVARQNVFEARLMLQAQS